MVVFHQRASLVHPASVHVLPPTIPTGFHLSAQGCEARATLGPPLQNSSPTPTGLYHRCACITVVHQVNETQTESCEQDPPPVRSGLSAA